MPVTPTYPGVYIEEIPSGVRTITGVATSITAFVGSALRGPIDKAVMIHSFGDFERGFGGLWVDSSLGYAVRDFFINGGSDAIAVRLYKGNKPIAKLKKGDLALESVDPGAWGNSLRMRVDNDILSEAASRLGLQVSQMFNLMVRDGTTGVVETFRNLTFKDSPRRVDRVLAQESNLVRFTGSPDGSETVPPPHNDPAQGSTIWDDDTASTKVGNADRANDSEELTKDEFVGTGMEANKEGLYSLLDADLFNLLCIPPYRSGTSGLDVQKEVLTAAQSLCENRRAFFIVDPPSTWDSKEKAKNGIANLGVSGSYAALFFPRLMQPDPMSNDQLAEFAPCGAVAGVMARTDAQRGVWKAPAGLEATLKGVPQLKVPLTDLENGELNPLGINCLRTMPAAGRVVWGARTLEGDDRLASEYKYIPVRRMALYLEESLFRGTKWVVFEPNDEPLWSQIRLNIGAFLHSLFRQGAFAGMTPRDAYFVKCDKETTTQDDVNRGIVNILVGFAPLKPAEFVMIKIQQISRPIAT